MAALVALGGGASMAPAHAVPPTVTPSPGYDARLQEQRAAQSHYESAAPGPRPRPALRRHRKWIHDGAH
jgi:hypothetical protein